MAIGETVTDSSLRPAFPGPHPVSFSRPRTNGAGRSFPFAGPQWATSWPTPWVWRWESCLPDGYFVDCGLHVADVRNSLRPEGHPTLLNIW